MDAQDDKWRKQMEFLSFGTAAAGFATILNFSDFTPPLPDFLHVSLIALVCSVTCSASCGWAYHARELKSEKAKKRTEDLQAFGGISFALGFGMFLLHFSIIAGLAFLGVGLFCSLVLSRGIYPGMTDGKD
jgi:hypothetical protein